MYNVILSDLASKQLKKLEAGIQKRIISALERIRLRPEAYIEKLVDEPGYKMRVGDYRIIMDVQRQDSLIFVVKVGHRRNIYQ